MNDSSFVYDDAFARNLGWVTAEEQGRLHAKRIAIAGLGGVGGSHLLTLARLGIGAFNIADFDLFAIANFNRQAGATVSTLDRPKIDVLAEMALDINPTLAIERFPMGVEAERIDAFLAGVDLYVDGLDYFALDIRRKVFARCAELGIPAITAAPLGMGVALINFLPGGNELRRLLPARRAVVRRAGDPLPARLVATHAAARVSGRSARASISPRSAARRR